VTGGIVVSDGRPSHLESGEPSGTQRVPPSFFWMCTKLSSLPCCSDPYSLWVGERFQTLNRTTSCAGRVAGGINTSCGALIDSWRLRPGGCGTFGRGGT